jgi:hypothetical protein
MFFQARLGLFYARADEEFKLSLPVEGSKSSTSLRRTLEIVHEKTGKMPQRLANLPEMPGELRYLWGYYNELQTGEALTFTEIRNWSELTCRNITSKEVLILKSLDDMFQRVKSDHLTKKTATPPDNGPVSTPNHSRGRPGRSKGR